MKFICIYLLIESIQRDLNDEMTTAEKKAFKHKKDVMDMIHSVEAFQEKLATAETENRRAIQTFLKSVNQLIDTLVAYHEDMSDSSDSESEVEHPPTPPPDSLQQQPPLPDEPVIVEPVQDMSF